MKLKLLCVLLTAFTIAFGGETFARFNEPTSPVLKPTVIHVPVTSLRQNDKLVVEARVDGTIERVVFMRLYYKSQSADAYEYVEMGRGGLGYFGEVPPDRFTGAKAYYFILVMLANQEVITYPEFNPYGSPVEVSIASDGMPAPAISPDPVVTQPLPQTEFPGSQTESLPASEEGAASVGETAVDDSPVLLLSPEEGEVFGVGEEVVIAVSLLPPLDEPIDSNSLNLYVDGMNMTHEAEISENLITYTTSSLSAGPHDALVQGYYKSGIELPRVEVNFTIKGKKRNLRAESPVRGRVFAETRHEDVSDIGFHDNIIGGALSGRHGIAKYDAKLYLTTREDSRFQPRNRYSFNLELPILKLSVGDIYPRFNDLMLWGKRVRGLHGGLHFGFFNVDVVTGQTTRRVSALREVVIDTSTGTAFPSMTNLGSDSTSITSLGTFSQNLFGLRTSFGSGRNFQWGLNFLKVKDDSTDLGVDQFGNNEYSLAPQDNIVVGTDFLLAFANRRIEFRAGAAYSLLTEDIFGGPITEQDLQQLFPDFDVPIDPAQFKDFLIINLSTSPLEDPRKGKSVAFNSSFRFNFFNNNFVVGYKRIGGGYVSLGNSFLRNNLKGFYVQDRIRLLQNKLYLNLGFESFDDNFDSDDQNNPTKLRTINSGFTVYPGRNWPNFTFNLRNHNRDNDIDSLFIDLSGTLQDTTDSRENNSTNDYSVQMNYDTRFFNVNHTISVSYIASNRNDVFVPETENTSNVQVVSVRTQYQLPLITTINFARNDNNFGNGLSTFNFNMLGFRAEYPFFRNKVKAYLATNFTSASGQSSTDTTTVNSVTDYKRTAFNMGARLDLSTTQFFALDASFISFQDDGFTLDSSTNTLTPNQSFTDRIFRIYYEKRF